jgi:hypothetical protein
MRKVMAALVCVAVLAASFGGAAEVVGEKPASPPPLPLHSIEGFGGVYLTETAYLVNPPTAGGDIGLPSVSVFATDVGEKFHAGASATLNFLGRIELGYSYQYLSLGDWDNDVEDATGLSISDDDSRLHTVGLRVLVVREGEGDTTWVPAITLGARYKKNTQIDDIDDDLLGTVGLLGYDDDDSVDFTLTASKTFAGILPKPFILSATVRSTEAIHAGFVGFSDDRELVLEGNAIFFITDQLVLAGEYRQMPDELKSLGNLVGRPDDWWSLALGYVVNNQLTLTAGFANMGRVLEDDENFCVLGQVKYEF